MTRRPSDPTQKPVFGLHHSAYRCRDAEETRAFYEDVLGFPLRLAMEVPANPVTQEPVNYMHVFFDIGSRDPDAPEYIAFFDAPGHDDGEDGFRFRHQSGLNLHFAMKVENVEAVRAWHERLVARGIEVEGPIDHGICTSIYFHDPNGYRLEFTTEAEGQQAEFDRQSAESHDNLARWTAEKAARTRAAAE